MFCSIIEIFFLMGLCDGGIFWMKFVCEIFGMGYLCFVWKLIVG